jgi:hypothetical protein
MPKCPICFVEYSSSISLSIHYRSIHKKTAKELFVELYCNGVEPTCKCGCGSAVRYLSIEAGFTDYVRGHASRVNNNWGHNKKARENSLETRREMLQEGTWKPFVSIETGEHWGKGLTKETDPRIAKMSESIKSNSEEIERRSKRMRTNRFNGIIPTLSNERHSQWKGGISCLRAITYSRLYREWKRPKLEKAGFKCQLCESAKHLEVHHDEESFASILNRLAIEFSWKTTTWCVDPKWQSDSQYQETKSLIADAVADYHIKNNVSGIVLCEECHKKQHNKHNL